MATATARKVAASGFGADPASREVVVRSPKPAPVVRSSKPAPPVDRPAARTGGRPASASRPASTGPARKTPAAGRRPAAGGRGPDHRAPKIGPTSTNRKIRLGSVRAQHLLMGELLLCLVIIVLADVMESGDVTSLPIEATGAAALFLMLALVSTGGRGPERVAVALGGLVTLGVVVKRWGVFPAISNTVNIAYLKAHGSKSATVSGGAAPGDVTAANPGPPADSPVPPPTTRIGRGRTYAV